MKKSASFRRSVIALALAGSFGVVATESFALPQGGAVSAGAASIVTKNSTMTVTQATSSATYNWQSFNIGKAESVHFQQPGANSVALNYVLGNSNSLIDGSLTSNGQLFLSNPNGILFGSSSQVNVAGLTLDAGKGQIATAGKINVNGGAFSAKADIINHSGLIEASSATAVGGRIVLSGRVALIDGAINANGSTGGSVLINASNISQSAAVTAKGVSGAGGSINLTGNRIVQTSSSLLNANSVSGKGGSISLITTTVATGDVSTEGRVFTSGSFSATGAQGGDITMTGHDVILNAATVDASGKTAGGNIRIGGDYQGKNPQLGNATTTTINAATIIRANARSVGNGGRVIVWSDSQTQFQGDINARGGTVRGDGGFIEVSGKQDLSYAGKADAGATQGKAGALLLDPKNIIVAATAPSNVSYMQLLNPNPNANGQHGSGGVTELANGNIVVLSPLDNFVANNAGAVFLYNGKTGALISALRGTAAGDKVGAYGITTLYNGMDVAAQSNFLVSSYDWGSAGGVNAGKGAVTWVNGTTGLSGSVSAANSLVGSKAGDRVGYGTYWGGTTILSNGNYVVVSPLWDNGAVTDAGAVTWGNGKTGVKGVVSAANSLVGSATGDQIGSDGVTQLYGYNSNNGTYTITSNYLVRSAKWGGGGALNAGKGAVTWGSGTAGVKGVVSAANSLVGSTVTDRVGSGGITYLNRSSSGFANGVYNYSTNTDYLISTATWGGGAGAVTWGNGASGVVGVVGAQNSLIGSTPNDNVGGGGITTLYQSSTVNGVTTSFYNYLVSSPDWGRGAGAQNLNMGKGAVTWANGKTGVKGAVSVANSLVGSVAGDRVGLGSSLWSGSSGITTLSNGNYLVKSAYWGGAGVLVNAKGAVTWGSGATGVRGVVGATNSLVGAVAGDQVGGGSRGYNGVTVLSNGNYVVSSPYWDKGGVVDAGAVTFGSNTTGVRGAISATNSLVGGATGDKVGMEITALNNGKYAVLSSEWGSGGALNMGKGAVTIGDPLLGIKGTVSAANSLVGGAQGDRVGSGWITPLWGSSNYLVLSPEWGGAGQFGMGKGAVTFIGATPKVGVVSAANSLVGAAQGDNIGGGGNAITTMSSGYVVKSSNWGSAGVAGTGKGAVTWGSNTTGISGVVGAANSLVGAHAGDQLGSGGITLLGNGNYVVNSPLWDNGLLVDAGAVTWANGALGAKGVVSGANSLVGAAAGDLVGGNGITVLNGTTATGGIYSNYLVLSQDWGGAKVGGMGKGAVTWGNGSTGVRGAVSSLNSLVGAQAGDRLGSGAITTLKDAYVVSSPFWDNGAVVDAGAVTWGNAKTGIKGMVGAANSLVGSATGDKVGSGGVQVLQGSSTVAGVTTTYNHYLVLSRDWGSGGVYGQGKGAVTWGNGTTGIKGVVSGLNSLVGSKVGDQVGVVTVLSNGNYLVSSAFWDNGLAVDAGAVTWGSGKAGVQGAVSAANSLVGTATGDRVGAGGITQLNGSRTVNGVTSTFSNYLVNSSEWGSGGLPGQGKGAVTWGNGSQGVKGAVSAANSLVGGKAGDLVGTNGFYQSITTLSNGNYIVSSQLWDNGLAVDAGAVTWGDGAVGVRGAVSSLNSLVGNATGDKVGGGGIQVLGSNYLVKSFEWGSGGVLNAGKGAITWGDGNLGVKGVVSATNSLVGAAQYDRVGYGTWGYDGITVLADGNYLVYSPNWGGNNVAGQAKGAVTWGNATTGVRGVVGAGNSLVGKVAGDQLGSGGRTPMYSMNSRGSVIVSSPFMDSGAAVDAGSIYIIRPPTFGAQGFTNGGAGATVTISAKDIAAVLNTGTSLVLQASNDITVNAPIVADKPGSTYYYYTSIGGLTLQAGRSVLLNAGITMGGVGSTYVGLLDISGNNGSASGVLSAQRDVGNAVITMANGVAINSGGAVVVSLKDGAGNVNKGTGAITLGKVTAANSLQVLNTGPTAGSNIVLNGQLTVGAGSYYGYNSGMVLASVNGNLINNAGATALVPGTGGRWVVYAKAAGNKLGGLTTANAPIQPCTYGATCATPIPSTGNYFVYH